MSISLELSANYNVKSDSVIVTIYPVSGNSYIGRQITSGTINLVYISSNSISVSTDILLSSVSLLSEYADNDGKFNIVFNHPPRISDLKIIVSITIASVVYNKSVDVLIDNIDLDTIGQNDALVQYEEFPPDSDERDDIQILEELDPIAVHIDFGLEDPIIKGYGELSYSGGGHRYLPSSYGTVIEQDVDEAPWTIHCATYCEESVSNLLDNNDFSGITGDIPVGFSASETDVLLTSCVTGDSFISSNTWELRYRLGHWTNPLISSTPVNVDITKPTTVAMFFGIYPQMSDRFINAKNITLRMKFYNNTSVVGTKNVNYLVNNLLDNMYIINNTAVTGDYPTGTNKISFEIAIGSIIQGDDFKVKLILPQIIQSNEITSLIRNLNIRENDNITMPQFNNVNLESGGFIIRFIPGYSGYPDTERCLFDTRGVTGQNGFVCSHLVSGAFNFTIHGQSGTYGVTSSAQTLSTDAETEIKVIYDIGEVGVTGGRAPVRSIYKDKVLITSSSGEFTPPVSIEQDIRIGSKYDSSQYLGGQLTEFIVMRKFD